MIFFGKKYYKALFIIFLLMVSCVTVYDTINNRNFSKKYNPGTNQIHPYYFLYKPSADKLFLYFQFFPSELAYAIPQNDSVAQARVNLFFRVTKNHSSIDIIDSLTTSFTLRGKPRSQFTGVVPIKLPDFGTFVIEIFLTDANSKARVSNILEIDNQLSGGGESYLFTSKYGSPVFHNFFVVGDTFRLKNEYLFNESIQVQYRPLDTVLPLPPDEQRANSFEIETNMDTIFDIPNFDTTLFSFAEQGTYIFTNKGGQSHRAIGVFQAAYPYVNTATELLKPLGYLTNKREMSKLMALGDPKKAMDSFWMETTGDMEKARELIRVYYNRVQLANYFFTDFNQGWMTDRGMIYIIFGIPAVVTIDDDGETWAYGKGSDGDLSFFFYREKHPVLGNYYQLNRSDQYSRVWFNATATWRGGRVFSVNN